MSRKRFIPVLALLIGIAAFAAACDPPNRIVVTTTTDELNNDGDCSLREAARAANLNAAVDECPAGTANDVIALAAGTYRLTVNGPREQQGLTGDLDFLAGRVEIDGAGRANTIIDGAGLDRILDVFPNVSTTVRDVMLRNGVSAPGRRGGAIVVLANGSMVLENVDIRNNRTSDGPDRIGDGGAIYNDGTMMLTNAIVRSNTAGGNEGSGGGVWNGTNGVMTVTRSTFTANVANGVSLPTTAVDGGGGIFNVGTMTITDSSIAANTTRFRGGGVANQGTLRIDRTTISGNVAAFGGGISSTNDAILTNVTISGNDANVHGGGVFVPGNTGPQGTVLANVTIALNDSDSDLNGTGDGGGVYVGASIVRLRNTLFYENKDLGGFSAPGCRVAAGELRSQGYNRFGGLTNCTITGDMTGNQVGGNSLVGPLAANGGPTQTHALLPGSPAIDAGNPAAPGSGGTSCAAVDQRGVTRPRDGNGDTVARCDIGAFEVQP